MRSRRLLNQDQEASNPHTAGETIQYTRAEAVATVGIGIVIAVMAWLIVPFNPIFGGVGILAGISVTYIGIATQRYPATGSDRGENLHGKDAASDIASKPNLQVDLIKQKYVRGGCDERELESLLNEAFGVDESTTTTDSRNIEAGDSRPR